METKEESLTTVYEKGILIAVIYRSKEGFQLIYRVEPMDRVGLKNLLENTNEKKTN